MKRNINIWVILILFLALTGTAQAQKARTESYGQGTQQFSLATGSPGELGLLKALAAAFILSCTLMTTYDMLFSERRRACGNPKNCQKAHLRGWRRN